MVLFVTEKTVKELIIPLHPNCVVFTTGELKKLRLDEKNTLVYKRANILPDIDTLNACVEGSKRDRKSIKKVAKKTLSQLKYPSGDSIKGGMICIEMNTIIRLISEGKRPPLLVFLAAEGDDDRTLEINKMIGKYLNTIFSEFGFTVFTEKDFKAGKGKKGKGAGQLSRIFRCKDKRKAVKEALTKLRKLQMRHGALSEDGTKLYDRIRLFYGIEARNQGILARRDDDMDKSARKALAKYLYKALSGHIVGDMANIEFKNTKDEKKTAKQLAKLGKSYVKSYDLLDDLLGAADAKLFDELPKIKYSVKKSTEKKAKKFIKFFTDKDNLHLLRAVYGHLSIIRIGYEVGTKEYNANMSTAFAGFSAEVGADVGKMFANASKAHAADVAAKYEAKHAKKETGRRATVA